MEKEKTKIKVPATTLSTEDKNAAKELLMEGGKLITASLYKRSVEEAERVKAIFILCTSLFILFALLMVALGTALFIYPTEGVIWQDGTTLWGVVIFKLLIFIPLFLITWFFGAEAKRIHMLYEMIMLKSFVLKFAEDVLESNDKKEFVKDFLLNMALNIIKLHK